MTNPASTQAFATTTSTPDGSFSIIATAQAVLASGWTDNLADLDALIHASIRPPMESITVLSPTAAKAFTAPSTATARAETARAETAHATSALHSPLHSALIALEAFYDGDALLLADVAVHQKSGPFREHAWDVLRTVKPGEVVTYSEYASRSGRPAAVRAAASACAMNAAALFVPCHRVLRTDGSLGGFRYGLPVKESLLNRERQ